MYKHLLLALNISFLISTANAQISGPRKFKDQVFPNVDVTNNLSYAPGNNITDTTAYLFDFYQPYGDHSPARPLIIWLHGGGFKYGSKTAAEIKIWSNYFATLGYICAALNYRLSKKNPLFHFGELRKSCYYAIQDAKTAVKYFKDNHIKYNIDPNKIILAGNSAGGIIALQAAYSSNEELAKITGVTDSTVTLKPNDRVQIAGIINFWGGLFQTSWLNNAKVPIVSVYGSNDHIVKPDKNGTGLYGSIIIHEKADALHILNGIKEFDGFGHELQRHFNPLFSAGKPTQKRWTMAAQFAVDFYYNLWYK